MPKVNLPVIQEAPVPGHVSCLQCARCCTYVAVGINAPTTPKLATEVLWHLYHQGVSVCRDEGGGLVRAVRGPLPESRGGQPVLGLPGPAAHLPGLR